MIDIILDAMLNFCKTFINVLKDFTQWVLNVLDSIGLLFTYFSILLITFIIVSTYLKGLLVAPVVGCIIVTTLIYVNKSLKGGVK